MKEIIELLEKAKADLHYHTTALGIDDQGIGEVEDSIGQVLALLKQKPCKTCGGSGTVVNPTFGPDDPSQPPYLSCPDCQKPDAGEFTKRMRLYIKTTKESATGLALISALSFLKEACDLLDRQKAEIERLKNLLVWLSKLRTNSDIDTHPQYIGWTTAVDGGLKMDFDCWLIEQALKGEKE